MAVPEWDFAVLAPNGRSEMSIDLVASSIESPRSLSGVAGAMDATGGGLWMVKYGFDLNLVAGHKYYTMMARLLAGGVKTIRIPFLTDRAGPFPLRDLWRNPPTITSSMIGDFDLNAGTIAFQVGGVDAQPLVGGETFEINYGSSGDNLDVRAYVVTEIDVTLPDTPTTGITTYNAGIRPPLRQAAADGKTLRWFRPRCLMRLAPQQATAWSVTGFWRSNPSLTFIEAF